MDEVGRAFPADFITPSLGVVGKVAAATLRDA